MKLYAEVDDKDRKLKTLYGIVEYMDGTRLVCDKFYAVKEQEPCSDAISRQAVNILVDELARAISDERCCMSRGRSTASIMQDILDLPPVKPQEPKTGHWEWVQYDGNPNIRNWHCSECGRIVSGAITAVNPVYTYKYCPNCGAEMESEE